jgi:hypothetical protein
MLTGRKPITGRSFSERIFAVISQPPLPPSRIEGLQLCLPHRLESLIMRCLEKDPERRPQSMEELVASLGEIGRAESVQCESISRDLPAVHVRRASRHPGIRLTGVLLVCLFLIGLGIGAAYQFRSKEALSQAAPGPLAPPATPEAVVATPPPAPAGASRVILRFHSTPAGASVRRVGQAKPLGATPLEISVDSSDREEAFTLHLAGYTPEQVRLPLDRHGQATVILKKLPSRSSGPARSPDRPPAGKKPQPQSQDLGGTVDPFADQ